MARVSVVLGHRLYQRLVSCKVLQKVYLTVVNLKRHSVVLFLLSGRQPGAASIAAEDLLSTPPTETYSLIKKLLHLLRMNITIG